VLQVLAADERAFTAVLARHGLLEHAVRLGTPQRELRVRLRAGELQLDESWADLRRAWSETSWRLRRLRDDPQCADEEFAAQTDEHAGGLSVELSFDPQEDVAAPYVAGSGRPAVAILREQGVNSQVETAAAFAQAGFTAHDVHMSDLLTGRRTLAEFKGVVACGGFSFGDVLGAGEGWAKSILFHGALREEFARFFARSDSFALGICNGCQMFAALKSLIPGSEAWPRFVQNRSEQFEARFSLVEVQRCDSVLLAGMAGSLLPVAVSHGEGRAEFASAEDHTVCRASHLVGLRYVNPDRSPATRYPANPSGTPEGVAALTNRDGRVTIIMPHPERSFRSLQNSWRPADAGAYSGWMRLFRNARRFVG
jgi:phosphoribosylformylglycinamidine synthase